MVQRSSIVLGLLIASSSDGASGCNWGIRLQPALSGGNCSFRLNRKIKIFPRWESNGRTAGIETCSTRTGLAKEDAPRTQN
jgi:hypothetical protein